MTTPNQRSSALLAVEGIAAARMARTPLASFGPDIAPQTEADGYAAQRALHDLLPRDLGPLAGYKIGCTSDVMQQYLGIAHPCAGGMFASQIRSSGATIAPSDFVRAGVECEIAVRLARDLVPSKAPFTADSLIEAIASYHPAIEIVDDRYVDWRTLGVPTLIADDFFSAGCVLGDAVPRAQAPELADVVGRTIINGNEAGRGYGRDVLGHPHRALAWLANHLAGSGLMLRAGHVVMTGSLVQTVWLDPGDTVEVVLERLGRVSVRLA